MMVIRAQCTKPGLPNPDRVYALKVLFKIHESDTLTHVSIITANLYMYMYISHL